VVHNTALNSSDNLPELLSSRQSSQIRWCLLEGRQLSTSSR